MIGKMVKVSYGKSSVVGILESQRTHRDGNSFNGDIFTDVVLNMLNGEMIEWNNLNAFATIELADE